MSGLMSEVEQARDGHHDDGSRRVTEPKYSTEDTIRASR